ncbi:Pyridoxal phosphate homeostasis protein [Botrimarina colliarenosi]|uniref:Pyridoxal phosphate homeostasis protein n=1 Tax=Botrimarina colliarenosi TaxID=2528001 RepID=A0A5C6ADJ0_9BACT|nr:YggS family pyridoxal phosphate-dependent enzyme [Botrimarina colliarenosi]TWT98034.1 Pyridoxal phosphate homeostasis protein [Botrimarina colliarenosi]
MTGDIDAVVRSNLARVQERIATACAAAGRPADEVTLVGVSKYVAAAETAALVAAGCATLGEARPQQLWAKAEAPELADLPIAWRLIGHLQRNKVERTVATVASIDSVDSLRLLASIDKAAAACGKTQAVLLEVNESGDAEKHGFAPTDLPAVLAELSGYPHVQVTGLMTMAARSGDEDTARRNFAALRELRDRVATPDLPLTELSMGMSGDFEEAILEGSTMVRVGSALWEGFL